MLEKMARSAHNRARRNFTNLPPWEQMPKDAQQQGMQMADAMLDALLEPSVEMERRGISTGETDDADGDVLKIFCAMIIAAKESK